MHISGRYRQGWASSHINPTFQHMSVRWNVGLTWKSPCSAYDPACQKRVYRINITVLTNSNARTASNYLWYFPILHHAKYENNMEISLLVSAAGCQATVVHYRLSKPLSILRSLRCRQTLTSDHLHTFPHSHLHERLTPVKPLVTGYRKCSNKCS